MDFYKWCSVLCHLWLLPSWITSKTVPDMAKEEVMNSTSQPDIRDSSPVFNTTLGVFNVTGNYETTSSTTSDSFSKATFLPSNTKKLSTKGYPVSGKNSSIWDLTTKPALQAENITAFIDKTSENKTSSGDYTNTVSSENSSVVTVTNKNMPLNTARGTEGDKSDSTTSELEGFRETTSVIYSTVGLDSNNTSVNITAPLDIDDTPKPTPHADSENDTSIYNASSISPSTSFHSTKAVTPSSTKKKQPIVWTTPHPNVIRNMWLAKRARSRTHTGSLHHLSLVPIEDGPFGSLIWKDKKYLITVLVPIGIGIIGAVCIISMAYVVRFCHRHERKMQEIRETIQKRYATQNDHVILLTNSSDDEF